MLQQFSVHMLQKDEKVFANTPTNNHSIKLLYQFIRAACFNQELGPLQVLHKNIVKIVFNTF
jgi:hypothetical protein